jgi:hypothetical protein
MDAAAVQTGYRSLLRTLCVIAFLISCVLLAAAVKLGAGGVEPPYVFLFFTLCILTVSCCGLVFLGTAAARAERAVTQYAPVPSEEGPEGQGV